MNHALILLNIFFQGRQEALGALNELQSKGIDFAKLLKEDDDEDEDDDGLVTSRAGSIRSRASTGKSRAGSIKQVSPTSIIMEKET